MNKIYELKDKVFKEIENFDFEHGSAAHLEQLTTIGKNLCKMAKAMEEEGGYSERGMSYARGGSSRGGSYDGGSYDGSYESGSYEGNSYARGRRNAPRDSMGRYSGEGYSRHGSMAEELRNLAGTAPEHMKREMERLAEKLEQQ